jgi:hypothetical protein
LNRTSLWPLALFDAPSDIERAWKCCNLSSRQKTLDVVIAEFIKASRQCSHGYAHLREGCLPDNIITRKTKNVPD